MNENKVTAEMLIESAGEPHVVTLKCGDIDIHIKTCISMRDRAEIVENVCVASFDDDGNYLPYVTNYMYNVEILRKYTDIEMPESLDDCLKVVEVMNTHFTSAEDGDTWMDAIRYAIGVEEFSLWNEIKDRINFELKKYERETHEMVQRIANMLRSLSLLVDDALGNMDTSEDDEDTEEDEEEEEMEDGDEDNEEVAIEMPVIYRGD